MDLSKFKVSPTLRDVLTTHRQHNPEVRLHTDLLQEISKLLPSAFPQFSLVLDVDRGARDVRKDSDGVYYVISNKIAINHRNVRIGSVTGGYFRRRYSLCISMNSPTGSVIENTTTADVGRAMTYLRRKLKPVSDHTIIESKANRIRNVLYSAHNKYSHALYVAKTNVSDLMQEFALQNMAAFVAAYPNETTVAALAKAVQESKDNAHTASMYEAYEKGRMLTAAELEGGAWLVGSSRFDSWDDMPEEHRTKIGLLRITEDGTILEKIGARVDATTFALCPEDEHGA